MKNNSFEEISEQLKAAKSVLLYTHINMDGDAIGSAVAMCKVLRNMGKECYVLLEDNISANLLFLDNDYCTKDQSIIDAPDVSMCLDCGDVGRFPKRKDKFETGKVSICVDHHATTDPFCAYNYIDPGAAATGELVYKLINTMGATIDKEIGEALFAAITTDTGNFQYSNTTKETHCIVASLYDAGIDSNYVSVQIYETVRMEKLMLKNRALGTLTMAADGKFAMAYVDQKMLAETGAKMEESEGIVSELRSIAGVQIAAFLKEDSRKVIKVSLRAKTEGDVSAISTQFNGGGHKKAAGCTMHCSLAEAMEQIKTASLENLAEYDK